MPITKKEQKTIDFYDTKANQFKRSKGREHMPSFWTDELEMFMHYAPNGHVVDIGAGNGREAQWFIEHGYQYTGIEPAAGLRTKLQHTFPNQTFISNTVYDWKLAPHTFDAFWCSAMLLHIPPENINIILQRIKNIIKPGGIGFISLAQGDGEYHDTDTGRFFYLYEQGAFAQLLKNNGFIIEKQYIKSHETHRPWLRSWLVFFVRANTN